MRKKLLIALLENIKRASMLLCDLLEDLSWNSRARQIYNLARELEDDIRKANQ